MSGVRYTATQVSWVGTKAQLPAPTPDRIIISRDIGDKGHKQFAYFAQLADAVAYAEMNRGGNLYEVVEDPLLPVRMFADIDRHDNKYSTEVVIDQVLSALSAYLCSAHACEWQAQAGENCQICESTRPGKTSVHITLNLRVQSMVAHCKLALSLIAFVKDHATDYPALLEQHSGKADTECCIDKAVYTKFRSFRLLHMSKKGKAVVLKPTHGSSDRIVDHMVNNMQVDYPEVHVHDAGESIKRKPRCAAEHKHVPQTMQLKDANAFVNTHASIVKATGHTLQVISVYDEARTVRFRLQKNTKCAYAGRVHANNNLYVHACKTTGDVTLFCHDDECRTKMQSQGHILSTMSREYAFEVMQNDAVLGLKDMHPGAAAIDWDEDYDEPEMRPLPVAPIVCVRAGMGLGKTIAVGSLLQAEILANPNLKVLVITFSRSLASKLHDDLQALKFVNYQDRDLEHTILAPRIVVCLDSLTRVGTRDFDFIVIDEAVSVMLHYNSPHMRKSSENAMMLELLVRQCKRGVYFLDAVLDTTFMTLVVSYFSKAKATRAVWVRNRHVRPTNRSVQLMVSSDGTATSVHEHSMVFAAAEKVLQLLKQGLRVVCCASTKGFTEILCNFISRQRPQTAILCYNSDRPQGQLSDINSTWCGCDLLIYSPSISAGVSFVPLHFDCLVAYLVNSSYAPTVDLALQQLFRVRQLRDGSMFLYVHNTPPNTKLADTVEEVQAMLDVDISLVNKNMVSTQLTFSAQLDIGNGTISYDRERLSFHIITGIVLTHNRSATSYLDLLVYALRKDYNILVESRTLPKPDKKAVDMDLAVLVEASKVKTKTPFKDLTLISKGAAQSVRLDIASANPVERAELLLFEFSCEKWGIPVERIDEAFYDNYVAPGTASDKYYKVKRFKTFSKDTVDQIRQSYARYMHAVLAMDDKNLELYQKRTKDHYDVLLLAYGLLNRVFTLQEVAALQDMQTVSIEESKLAVSVDSFLAGLTPSHKLRADKLFGLKLCKSNYQVVQRLMDAAMGMVLSRASKFKERPKYTLLQLGNPKLQQFEATYAPTYPMMS